MTVRYKEPTERPNDFDVKLQTFFALRGIEPTPTWISQFYGVLNFSFFKKCPVDYHMKNWNVYGENHKVKVLNRMIKEHLKTEKNLIQTK